MTPVADAHHVVRHCKKRHLVVENGKICAVFPEAFLLRENINEAYLSAHYFEFFAGPDVDRWKGCLADLSRNLEPKPRDGMMKLNVGAIKRCGAMQSIKLRVFHKGGKKSSYSGIYGLRFTDKDRILASMLAELASIDTQEVSSI